MSNCFAEFLELPESERLKLLTADKLPRWKYIYINHLNKWWTSMRASSSNLRAITLWESIYKNRF